MVVLKVLSPPLCRKAGLGAHEEAPRGRFATRGRRRAEFPAGVSSVAGRGCASSLPAVTALVALGRRPVVRARSHCRFVLLLIQFIPNSLTYSVPLYLKRQCDRTLFLGARRPARPRCALDRRREGRVISDCHFAV
jgi:hypothetical protein